MPPDAEARSSTRADPYAPLTSQHLDVGDGHEIYVETVGRVGGIPAVYLHGGPGSGCQPDHRKLFDPERFHAVLFDQRGAGRSRPKGGREANTLPHLIADMESIRKTLGFSRWMVYARVVFGLTRTLKQRPFVEAATLYGGNDRYIMRRHILPQVAPVLIVVATLQVAQMILQETALSFLGLGASPGTPDWGLMLAEGRTQLFVTPVATLAPGVMIVITATAMNLIGDWLYELLAARGASR